MTRKALIPLIITAILSLVLVLSVVGSSISWLHVKSITQKVNTYRYNEKILDFTKMFITLVLKANGEISFEDRLKLENSVRACEDQSVLSQWQEFTKAGPDQEAGKEAQNLFGLLLEKINQ